MYPILGQIVAPTLTGDATNVQSAIDNGVALANTGIKGTIIGAMVVIGIGVAVLIYRRLKGR